MNKLASKIIVSALLAIALAGCGGGGAATFGGGIGGTGLVIGPITDFGSIVVEGIEFDTTAAIVTIDGRQASASELALGMLVTVAGEIDASETTGVADTIEAVSMLEGPVAAVDVAAKTATILGQTVHVGRDTVLVGIAPDPSAIGQHVRVSGFVDADGRIRATRIERVAAGGRLVVTGTVRQLNALAKRFRLRGIQIDFSAAAIDRLPAGGLREGLLARVHVLADPVNGILRATRVEFIEPPVERHPDFVVRVGGFVSEVTGPDSFVLNDLIPVSFTADTDFVGGTAADLAPNVKVAVVGRATRQRRVLARRIVFR